MFNLKQYANGRSGVMGAGEHDVTFERGALTAGVYFYRITAGGASQTGAMVIAD